MSEDSNKSPEQGPRTERLAPASNSVRVPEKVARGVFASGFVVFAAQNEFVMDFYQGIAKPPQVVARVVMSLSTIEGLINLLREQLGGYAKHFGAPTAIPKSPNERQLSAQELYDELKVPEEISSGSYATGLMVNFNPVEFHFDFVTGFFPNASVSSRVYLAAPRVQNMIDTLENTRMNMIKQRAAATPASAPTSGPATQSAAQQPRWATVQVKGDCSPTEQSVSMSSFYITAVETSGLGAVENAAKLTMGEIYCTPYDAVVSPHVTHSYGSDVGNSVASSLQYRGFKASWSGIVVRLTPALGEREVRILKREVQKKTDFVGYEVALGLRPETWRREGLLGKRRLLASLLLQVAQVVGQIEHWNIEVCDGVLKAIEAEQLELKRAQERQSETVATSPGLAQLLAWETWTRLGVGGRREIFHEVDAALRAAGRDMQFHAEVTFGPPEEPQALGRWEDCQTGMMFSLLPGGHFRPGFGTDAIGKYREVFEQLNGFIREAREEIGTDEGMEMPEPDDFSGREAVVIRPMLMACHPIVRGCPAVAGMVDPEMHRMYGQMREKDRLWCPLYCTWGETGPILRKLGWVLPSSAELEWSIRGGKDEVFWWGNQAHLAPCAFHSDEDIDAEDGKCAFEELLHDSFEPEHPRRWPWVNRFGLENVLGHKTWCLPGPDLEDISPLVMRGSAAAMAPWQCCREWELLVSAGEHRRRLDSWGLPPQAVIRGAILL